MIAISVYVSLLNSLKYLLFTFELIPDLYWVKLSILPIAFYRKFDNDWIKIFVNLTILTDILNIKLLNNIRT